MTKFFFSIFPFPSFSKEKWPFWFYYAAQKIFLCCEWVVYYWMKKNGLLKMRNFCDAKNLKGESFGFPKNLKNTLNFMSLKSFIFLVNILKFLIWFVSKWTETAIFQEENFQSNKKRDFLSKRCFFFQKLKKRKILNSCVSILDCFFGKRKLKFCFCEIIIHDF